MDGDEPVEARGDARRGGLPPRRGAGRRAARAGGQLDEGEREAAQRPRAVREARGAREVETASTRTARRIQQCSRNFAPAPPPERGGKKRAAAPNPLSRKPPKRRGSLPHRRDACYV